MLKTNIIDFSPVPATYNGGHFPVAIETLPFTEIMAEKKMAISFNFQLLTCFALCKAAANADD